MLDRLRDGGAALSRFTERWTPDAWVILMSLTVVALILAVTGGGATVPEAGLAWGAGVWTLLELAMQFSIAMVAAHACASSPPMYRLLDRLARCPNPERPVQAVALAAAFSMLAGYLNWAFGLVGSALFVPFILKRNPRADVRLVIAAAYMGIGTVWQSGLSSSAPLILATPGNPLLEPGTGAPIVDRLYPVTETLFHPFNLGYAVVMLLVGLVAAMALHPHRDVVTLTEAEVDAILPAPTPRADAAATPAERLDRFRGWSLLAAILLAYPLVYSIVTRGFGASWTINAYNTVFLVLALVLHGRPTSFLRACRDGVGAASGIILQFPFYAGIFGLIQNTNLGGWLGEQFAAGRHDPALSARGLLLFGTHEPVHPLGRLQVDDRGAVHRPRRRGARRLRHDDPARVRVRGLGLQPHPPVLGAADPRRDASPLRGGAGIRLPHLARDDPPRHRDDARHPHHLVTP